MFRMVVHLLLINEHFFVWNLYVSGNGNDFSRMLELNIWDYIISSRADVSKKCAMFFWAAVTY